MANLKGWIFFIFVLWWRIFHQSSRKKKPNIAAPDVNDDGWPDLHLGVSLGLDRLFLNDGHGTSCPLAKQAFQ